MKYYLLPWITFGVLALFAMSVSAQETGPKRGVCRVLADERLETPVTTIATEFQRRSGVRIALSFLPVAEVNAFVEKGRMAYDAVLHLAEPSDGQTALASLPDATRWLGNTRPASPFGPP